MIYQLFGFGALIVSFGLIAAWAYSYGHLRGYRRGQKRGRRDADKWWLLAERQVDEELAELWRKEG